MKSCLRLTPILIVLCAVFLVSCTSPASKEPAPRAEKGVLDLRNWDFEKNGSVDLSGEWQFFWKQLASSGKILTPSSDSDNKYFVLPNVWNGQVVNGEEITGHGFATFKLKVLLPSAADALSVNVQEMMTAYTLSANGQQLMSNGQVGDSLDNSSPMYLPSVEDIKKAGSELNFVLEVSNFHHRKGGPRHTVQLGSESDIRDAKRNRVLVEVFLIGSILFMGLYHLTMFLLRRGEHSALFFGLFAFLITIRTGVTGERFLIGLLPELGWEIYHTVEYLTFYLALPLFVMFIRSIFPTETPKIFLRLVQAAGLIFSVVVIVTPARVYSIMLQGYQLITLVTGLFIIFILVRAALKKRDGALTFIGGFLILFLFVINDILYANEVVQGGFLLALGLFAFLFSQSFLLSSRSAQAFSLIENQKDLLSNTNIALKNQIGERKKLEVDLEESHQNFMDSRIATILGLAKLAEYRDNDTGMHLERMREYSRMLTVGLANHPKYKEYITQEYIDDIFLSAILHDIGKVGIPDSILLKPGKLEFEEFDIMKGHSGIGGDAISTVADQVKIRSFLTLGRDIAYYHHEKWNGAGYPHKLVGEKIPLSARIIAVADVYDALTSVRPYKKAFPHQKAREIIESDKGTHFDPDLVDIFLDLQNDFDKIRSTMQDSD
jgi:adenylate cyclase